MSQALKKILLIIPHDNFNDKEYQEIVERLAAITEEVKVEIASSHLSEAQGLFKSLVMPDVLIDFVEAGDYNGFIFIGEETASEYYSNSIILNLLDQAHQTGKIIAAIGEAVPIIAYTGKLAGLRVTGPEVERRRLEELGVFFTSNRIEISDNYVTACGPEAATDFATAIANILN